VGGGGANKKKEKECAQIFQENFCKYTNSSASVSGGITSRFNETIK
jgi:hypothetical protein